MFPGSRSRLAVVSSIAALTLVSIPACDRPSAEEVLGTNPAQAPAQPQAPAAAPVQQQPPAAALKPAEPSTFHEIAARLDHGGSLFLYLSTEEWLTGLSKKMDSLREFVPGAAAAKTDPDGDATTTRAFDIATRLVQKSGLEQVTGIGMSSIAIEPGLYRNKLFVHHHKGDGDGFLWTTFGKEPHELKALQWLPVDTAFATSADFDLGALLNVILTEIDQAGIPEAKMLRDQISLQIMAATGMSLDELLQSLGQSHGVIVTLDPSKTIQLPVDNEVKSAPTPRLAVFLEVKDDRLFKQVEKALASNPQVESVDESDLRMRTMVFPVMPELTLRATVAQWGNYLVVASDDQLIRDMVAAQASSNGFIATPEFKRLAEGMPTEGNGFTLATQRFVDTWTQFQGNILKAPPGLAPTHVATMQKLMADQKSGAAYTVSAHVEDGWLVTGKGTQGATQVAGPLLIAPAAVLASVAIPTFGTASTKAELTKSQANAKQIAVACRMYALENDGKFPADLNALVPTYLPSAELLKSPLDPADPIGYQYTSGLTVNSPGNPVLLEDKFAAQKNQKRVVVRMDGSGEIVPAEAP